MMEASYTQQDWTNVSTYPAQCAVKSVYGRAGGPLVLEQNGRVFGVIFRLKELVDTHSFPSSPFPIGQLLKNAVLASQLVHGSAMAEGPWHALRSYNGELIALLSAQEAPILPPPNEAAQPIAA